MNFIQVIYIDKTVLTLRLIIEKIFLIQYKFVYNYIDAFYNY